MAVKSAAHASNWRILLSVRWRGWCGSADASGRLWNAPAASCRRAQAAKRRWDSATGAEMPTRSARLKPADRPDTREPACRGESCVDSASACVVRRAWHRGAAGRASTPSSMVQPKADARASASRSWQRPVAGGSGAQLRETLYFANRGLIQARIRVGHPATLPRWLGLCAAGPVDQLASTVSAASACAGDELPRPISGTGCHGGHPWPRQARPSLNGFGMGHCELFLRTA